MQARTATALGWPRTSPGARSILCRGILCAGSWRSSNHTTTQVGPCPSPQPEVTISVSALLKLAQWCQRRLGDHSGEVVWLSPLTVPPACSPPHGSSQDVSGDYSTATLGESTGAESTASESARGSGHRPAPPFDAEGG